MSAFKNASNGGLKGGGGNNVSTGTRDAFFIKKIKIALNEANLKVTITEHAILALLKIKKGENDLSFFLSDHHIEPPPPPSLRESLYFSQDNRSGKFLHLSRPHHVLPDWSVLI